MVHGFVACLLQARTDSWTSAIADDWCSLLSRVSTRDELQLDLCSQALHFALEHRYLPLGSVVAASFYPVHDAAMRDSSERRSWFGWGFSDWDKAKDLRRSLVESFLRSSWEPKDFALAASEPWLLKKLCNRMRRQWGGPEYIQRAYLGVVKESAPNAQQLAKVLSQYLADPDQYEDWD
jgi:hypothetical protein